jgi:hypothetical protein
MVKVIDADAVEAPGLPEMLATGYGPSTSGGNCERGRTTPSGMDGPEDWLTLVWK